jgi:hypothetical protein
MEFVVFHRLLQTSKSMQFTWIKLHTVCLVLFCADCEMD